MLGYLCMLLCIWACEWMTWLSEMWLWIWMDLWAMVLNSKCYVKDGCELDIWCMWILIYIIRGLLCQNWIRNRDIAAPQNNFHRLWSSRRELSCYYNRITPIRLTIADRSYDADETLFPLTLVDRGGLQGVMVEHNHPYRLLVTNGNQLTPLATDWI